MAENRYPLSATQMQTYQAFNTAFRKALEAQRAATAQLDTARQHLVLISQLIFESFNLLPTTTGSIDETTGELVVTTDDSDG